MDSQTSPNRRQLFDELLRLMDYLQNTGLPCNIWINGSYTCEKEEPDDIDLSIEFWATDAEKLDVMVYSEIIRLLNGGQVFSSMIDSYLCPRFDRTDPRHGADLSTYWGDKWGKGRDDWLKGFIVIAVGETNAQRRLAP